MRASLQALLGGILDYAGMFPPAALPLDEALRNFLRYRSETESWLLGRFVCPAARLEELLPALVEGARKEGKPFGLAIVGRGGKQIQEFFDNVRTDLADIARLREALRQAAPEIPGDYEIAYEVRLPEAPFRPLKHNQLSAVVPTVAYLIESAGPPVARPFFESPAGDRASLLAVIQALHDDAHAREASLRRFCLRPGLKLRAGGAEPATVPSSAQVALTLAACAAARVPFKATAGLHQPLRRFDAALGCAVHGFVNLFVAGCLAHTHNLAETQLLEILDDGEPGHFLFEPDYLRWKDFQIPCATLAGLRRDYLISFGSCSFDEPRDELKRLNWLEA